MSFEIEDDSLDVNVELASEIEVTKETLDSFLGISEETPNVELKLAGDEKSNSFKIRKFIVNRIVSAIESGFKRDWVVRHAAKTLTLLSGQAGVTLNNAESNALGLYRAAKQTYTLQKIRNLVSTLNSQYCESKGAIMNIEKPRFTSALFHAVCEQTKSEKPDLSFTYKAGRLEESHRFDNVFNLRAINALKIEREKIHKKAKSENRELTAEESAESAQFLEEIKSVWVKFFEGSKQIVGTANKLFPENVSTGRTTTSGLFNSLATSDVINFGAFEL